MGQYFAADEPQSTLGIDPGREKCGLALLSSRGEILQRRVAPLAELPAALRELCQPAKPAALALGNRTGHGPVVDLIRQTVPDVPLHLVEEAGSTLEARQLYFKEHPPRGWRRLLPTSLQTPPVPLDDYAAAVIARRFLATTAEPQTS